MVPVVDRYNFPLDPCSEELAQKLIDQKKAKPCFRGGVYHIKLKTTSENSNTKYDVVVNYLGTVYYYKKGTHALHREDGPAVTYKDGTKMWYLHGEYHRIDGPAIEYSNGNREWWVNGFRHREDGPAIDEARGYKVWYISGLIHRKDGPAIELPDGRNCWYLNGCRLSPEKEKVLNKWWNNKNGI
jgi:hypothetical protein